jgi:hypothetical protein
MPSLARGTPSDAPPHRLRRPQYHRRPRRCTRAAAGHRLRRVRWRAWLKATASGPAWKGWRQVGHAGESRPPPTVPCVAAFTRQSTCTKPAEPRQAQLRSSGAASLLGCRQHGLRTRASRAIQSSACAGCSRRSGASTAPCAAPPPPTSGAVCAAQVRESPERRASASSESVELCAPPAAAAR